MIYTTKAGDMWDSISYQQLGSCKFIETLINANRQFLPTYIFKAGVELVIPNINSENKVKKLPPWRLAS